MNESVPIPCGIMIVDDNITNLKLLEDMLLQQGYEVRSFPSGRLALAAAVENPPDLILLDITMPEMNGYEVCERLKANQDLVEIPVIFLSALNDTKDKVKAFRSGAVDYISKPFQFEEVHSRVKTHLELYDLHRVLEQRVEQRTLDLKQALLEKTALLLEKTTLLQEVHHRVKNNLQVVCSMLSMQIHYSGEEQASDQLREAYGRVLAMSLIHEHLYQSTTLSDLDFGEYIKVLSRQLFSTYCVAPCPIRLELSVEPAHLTVDQAIPCGLVLNELLANSLKHAFPGGREGVIQVRFSLTGPAGATLTVVDNGIGLPPGFHQDESKSLGLRIVHTLVDQLNGKLTVSGEGGTTCTLTWANDLVAPHLASSASRSRGC